MMVPRHPNLERDNFADMVKVVKKATQDTHALRDSNLKYGRSQKYIYIKFYFLKIEAILNLWYKISNTYNCSNRGNILYVSCPRCRPIQYMKHATCYLNYVDRYFR